MNDLTLPVQHARMRAALERMKRDCREHAGGDGPCRCQLVNEALAPPERAAPLLADPLTGRSPALVWDDLLQLAATDPVVLCLVELDQRGGYTREELLLSLVSYFSVELFSVRRVARTEATQRPPSHTLWIKRTP